MLSYGIKTISSASSSLLANTVDKSERCSQGLKTLFALPSTVSFKAVTCGYKKHDVKDLKRNAATVS